MIKILLPSGIKQQIIAELQKAGIREIGGILMGEHLSEGVFRIRDFTVQQQGGTWITFVRKVEATLKDSLRSFFRNNAYQYTRYNYIGEWHSHPSFTLTPSLRDQESMWDVVNDPNVGANFAILLIVKMQGLEFNGSVSLFVPGYKVSSGELILEGRI